MQLFTPPTDSFYKFLAISGLIAMVSSSFLLFRQDKNNYNLLIKLKVEEKILQKEILLFMDEITYNIRYKKIIDSIPQIKNVLNPELYSQTDSINKKILFNLPDSIKDKIKTMVLKKENLIRKREFINKYTSNYESYFIIYLICLYGGEITAIIGFLSWYYKIEKPTQKKLEYEQNKLLEDDLWQEFCQSCYKTIYLNIERGTEKDGSFNRTYCKKCYQDGKFVEPDLKFEEAKKRLISELKKRKYSFFKIKKYTRELKKCIRWIEVFKW